MTVLRERKSSHQIRGHGGIAANTQRLMQVRRGTLHQTSAMYINCNVPLPSWTNGGSEEVNEDT